MKALQVIKTVLAVIGLFALGVLTGALFGRKTDPGKSEKSEQARKDRKDEIEQPPADVLVSDAHNSGELLAAKDGIKKDFRERVRHRLEQELQRLGSSGASADSGTGSRPCD